MKPALVVQIVTPKKVHLNGLWFGPLKPKRAFIMVHGLTGSAFSLAKVVEKLVDKHTAVFTFNNRGYEQISTVKQKRGKISEYILAGTAHEVFEDCVDDVQGAVDMARKLGAKKVYVIGHSTGANKTLFWSARSKRKANGIVLLGPLSDYAGAIKHFGVKKLRKSVEYAKKLVKQGNPHQLMPAHLREWFECDAQRFLSLYTPDSNEETFSYVQEGKRPTILKSVRTPILVALAGKDEYADIPTEELAQWFIKWIYTGEVTVIPEVQHSFRDGEVTLASEIKRFSEEL